MFFFFNQQTAYDMRISDWSSDVCSSDLHEIDRDKTRGLRARTGTAIDKAFSGQNARFITIGDALVLAEHIADFTPAYADVPSRHVRIFAQVAVQFSHE